MILVFFNLLTNYWPISSDAETLVRHKHKYLSIFATSSGQHHIRAYSMILVHIFTDNC